jgi:hypothetical protein
MEVQQIHRDLGVGTHALEKGTKAWVGSQKCEFGPRSPSTHSVCFTSSSSLPPLLCTFSPISCGFERLVLFVQV